MHNQTTKSQSLNARVCEWPLSMIGPEGPQLLTFDILGMGDAAPRRAGIFLYAKRLKDGQWQALYIGETGNLQNRLSFNEIAADALLSGATDIHVLLLDGDAKLRRDLCEKFIFTNRPPLNEQASRRVAPVAAATAASDKPRAQKRQGQNRQGQNRQGTTAA
jgi:hypothetical protein